MDTLYGAAFDPLLSVGGPLALKGLQTASNSTMRNLLPTQNEVFNSFGQSAKSDLMPKPLPSIQQNSNKLYNNLLQDLQLKTNPSTQLQEGLNNFRQTEQQPLTVNAEPLPTTPNEKMQLQ
jgi:hypothetical protein